MNCPDCKWPMERKTRTDVPGDANSFFLECPKCGRCAKWQAPKPIFAYRLKSKFAVGDGGTGWQKIEVARCNECQQVRQCLVAESEQIEFGGVATCLACITQAFENYQKGSNG